jgi:hypothetical protein
LIICQMLEKLDLRGCAVACCRITNPAGRI